MDLKTMRIEKLEKGVCLIGEPKEGITAFFEKRKPRFIPTNITK